MARPQIFRSLLRALQTPEARAKVIEAERAIVESAAKEPGGLVSWIGRAGLGATSPKALKAVERRAGGAYARARAIDEAIASQLAKIPVAGGAFRGRQRAAVRTIEETPRGAVRELVEVPTASLLEPVAKTQRVAGPILALLGIEALRRSATEGSETAMEPKYSSALKVAAETLRQREKQAAETIRKHAATVAHQKRAMEILAEKLEAAGVEKKAASHALNLLQRGLITADQFEEKVATITSQGEDAIRLEEKALQFVEGLDKGASAFGVAESPKKTESSLDKNETIEYLAEYAYAEGASADE